MYFLQKEFPNHILEFLFYQQLVKNKNLQSQHYKRQVLLCRMELLQVFLQKTFQ